jgi:hypothetical protein
MATDDLMRLQAIPKAEFDPGLLNSSFQSMNGSGFADNIKIFQMYNPSATISIEVSLNGVDPHFFWPPKATLIIDMQTNHASGPTHGGGVLYGAQGQILYGRLAVNPSFVQMMGMR